MTAARRTITDRVIESDHDIAWLAWAYVLMTLQVAVAVTVGAVIHFAAIHLGGDPWVGSSITGVVAWFIWLVRRLPHRVQVPATWTYALTGVGPHEFDAIGPAVATAVAAGLTIPGVELGWSIDGHDSAPLDDDAAVVFRAAVVTDPWAVATALRSVRPIGLADSPIVADARELADRIVTGMEHREAGR